MRTVNKTKMLELPDVNMTNGRFRNDKSEKTGQFCVIPNTEDNRSSIRHINKLAKQQNSFFRLRTRYRCPKEGKHYGFFGDVSRDNADGIGIYIKNVNRRAERLAIHQDIRKRDDEISRLNEEIAYLKDKIVSKNAVKYLIDACDDYRDDYGENNTYRKMRKMVKTLWIKRAKRK